MNSTIGCVGLIAIAVFIVLLALWSRKSREGVREFYAEHNLVSAEEQPENVREAIGVRNAICLSGKLMSRSRALVPFYWWEWSTSSLHSTGTGVQGSISCFLAISFPPGTVSERFEQKALAEKEAKASLPKMLKGLFALNTNKPIRIENLADGSFVIFWQVVQQAKVMEDKIAWLKDNL